MSLRLTALLLATGLALAACASSSARVTRGDGDALAVVRALPESARPRVAVLPVLDHTPPYGVRSLDLNLTLINLGRPVEQSVPKTAFTGAVHDMLLTELFNSGGFIVLEREALPAVLAEQAFAASDRFDARATVASGGLEGAQYLIAAAITAFDTGSEGGALPIPIPGVINSDVAALGVLNLGFKRGYVALDVRVLDTRSGRVLHSAAVEGRNTKWGVDLAAIAAARGMGVTQVPDLIKVFRNTPVEQALQKMTIAAVEQIATAFTAAAQPPVAAKATDPADPNAPPR